MSGRRVKVCKIHGAWWMLACDSLTPNGPVCNSYGVYATWRDAVDAGLAWRSILRTDERLVWVGP